MNRELIERIEILARYHAEHDGPFSDIVRLLRDCKDALSWQEAEPVAHVPLHPTRGLLWADTRNDSGRADCVAILGSV